MYFTLSNIHIPIFFSARIDGSSVMEYGQVQVYHNQTWVAVCDTNFDAAAARIVCRNLGYSEGKPQCCSALGNTWRMPDIGFVVSGCQSSDHNSLFQCPGASATASCPSGQYASVLCSNDPLRTNGMLFCGF